MNSAQDSNSENEVCSINTIILLAKSECHQVIKDNEYSIEIEYQCPFARTYFISPNEFIFINQQILADYLHSYNNFSGIILTSKRSIDALLKSIEIITNYDPKSLSKWIFFTVGPATKAYLCEKLHVDSIGDHTGSSEALAQFILEFHLKNPFLKPLLYPCSKIRSDPLIDILSGTIEIKEIAAYDTIVNPNVRQDVDLFKTTFLLKHFTLFQKSGTTKRNFELVVVFFSSSGVQNLFDHIKNEIMNDTSLTNENFNIRFVAFGKQTESKLKSNYNVNPWFVVSSPNSQSLAADLKHYFKNL